MELGRKIGEKTHLCTQNIRIYPKTALMMVFKVFLNRLEQKKKKKKTVGFNNDKKNCKIL